MPAWSFLVFCFCVLRCEASATRAWQANNPAAGVRAAYLSPSIYLETEADVESYVAKLKAELLDIIQSGKRARIS